MSDKEKEIVKKICDCDMNLSLVARELYMHRNTIVYHCDRIKEKTGLNPLKFNDLVKLKDMVGEDAAVQI